MDLIRDDYAKYEARLCSSVATPQSSAAAQAHAIVQEQTLLWLQAMDPGSEGLQWALRQIRTLGYKFSSLSETCNAIVTNMQNLLQREHGFTLNLRNPLIDL